MSPRRVLPTLDLWRAAERNPVPVVKAQRRRAWRVGVRGGTPA